jgi:hypothetical protein
MTGPDPAHDDHHSAHPAAASVVVLVIAAVFGLLFKAIESGWTTAGIVAAGLLAVWGLVYVWALDKD